MRTRKGKKIKCLICGKKVYRYPSQSCQYCSKKCWYIAMREGKNPMFGKKHNPETIKKIRIKHLGRKLSKETKRKISITSRKNARYGSKSNFWKGGISSENNRLRHCLKWKLWRIAVFERNKFICQKCKQRGRKITPHHICNFEDYPELRFNVANGITLCEKCHRKFHKKYGRQNTTKGQLEKFLV